MSSLLTNYIFFIIIFGSHSAAGAKYKVAVLGGGPSGACAAEALAKNPNI